MSEDGVGGSASPSAVGLRVLGHRNVWPYVGGNFLSNCGTWFQNIAQALLVYRLTQSTFLVGVVNFAQFVGTFALASWAGAAADRFDRRRLVIGTQLSSLAVTASLATVAALGAASAPIVIALALLLGTMTAFSTPAMLALVPSLVPPKDVAGVLALHSMSFNLARAVGPLLGVAVIGILGIPAAFAINSLSYLALVLGLLLVTPTSREVDRSIRPKLRETFRIIRRSTSLLRLMAAVMALSLAADPVTTLTPEYATDLFGRSEVFVGLLMASFGAGSMMAVGFVGREQAQPLRRVRGALLVLAGGISLFAIAPSVHLAAAGLFIAGFGFLLSNATATTAIALIVDDSQRGRVMAIWSMAFLGVRPFGSLFSGTVAALLGVRIAAAAMAIPAVVASVVISRLIRSRRAAEAGQRGVGDQAR